MNYLRTRTFRVLCCVVPVLVLWGSAALGALLFEGPLTTGDYGEATAIDTMDPDHGGSPHVLGIADAPDGVTFTSTEADGRSNALINWEIPSSNRTSFRTSGTVSVWIKGDRDAHAAMASWGALWGENYGFTAFHHGQSSFSAASSHVANDPGTEDDQLRIYWQAWHNSVWYQLGGVYLEYGRWYHIGFAWGGATHDYELWVDGELASSYDLPVSVSLPWGTSSTGVNWGLGDNHERGYDAYGSNVGITYANIHIWDEYRELGDTTALPAADFSGTPTIGFGPLDVAFTDESTGAPTSWAWDFGDGNTSTQQSPSHQYTEVGTHGVSLTAGDCRGGDTETKAHYVIVTFPDVPFEPEPHWAMYHILACVDAEVVAGYDDGLYHPDVAVTRDQMAVYIARALAGGEEGVPTGPAVATFDDVPTDYWSFDHIEHCFSSNVVQGYDAVTYAPTIEVTRDQMAVYVARALVSPSGEAALSDYVPADPRDFPDVPSTGYGDGGTDPFWAYKHIEYCVENDVVQGYDDGYYHPEYVVTRDQMAVYIARAFALPMAN